jgi:RimJ/RimL family protein N-acetyltransferase
VHLDTEIEGLVLRPLGVEDLDRYADLIASNRDHLTRHGDYRELVAMPRQELEDELRSPVDGRLGVWLAEELIGRADLVPKDGTNAVLGYWLDRNRLGLGFATAACCELLRYGASEMGVTDAWAGVTRGNDRSVAVLERLGFEAVRDMGAYTRFHRALPMG